MRGAITTTIAIVAGLSAVWFYSQDRRWHARYEKAIRDHTMVRVMDVRAALAGAKDPVVILGDSVTEFVHLPDTFEGRTIVNAGVRGTTIEQARRMVPVLFENSKPATIVITLGMNNRDQTDVTDSYGRLIADLQLICPNLVSVAVTPADGADAVNARIRQAADAANVPFVDTHMPAETTDGVHPNEIGYRTWVPAVLRAGAGARMAEGVMP
jgi:GDSL-like Lipase/Acylhydrolase family